MMTLADFTKVPGTEQNYVYDGGHYNIYLDYSYPSKHFKEKRHTLFFKNKNDKLLTPGIVIGKSDLETAVKCADYLKNLYEREGIL